LLTKRLVYLSRMFAGLTIPARPDVRSAVLE
jgi:hypothetical protein